MKILRNIARVLLGLLILTPILGVLGVFPAPTADLYTPQGWAFMSALMATGYMMWLIGVLCLVCLVLIIMNKTALAAVLLAPFSVNVILFHIFLDGTPAGVWILSGLLFILNAFFLWEGREKYKTLW